MSETFADNRDEGSGPKAGSGGQPKPQGVAGVVEEARRQGEEIADIAKERATGFAEEQKAVAAKHVGAIAGAVEKTAEGLEEASPDLARYARRAADKARDLSSALENSDVRGLLGTAGSYARREPAIFFGAAVAAGFALARFLKSSPEPGHGASGAGQGGPSTSGATSYAASSSPSDGAPSATRQGGGADSRYQGEQDQGGFGQTLAGPREVASAAAPEGGPYGA